MIRFCGRCLAPFVFTDVVTYAPGMVAHHSIYCPRDRWPVDWRERLKATP